MSLSLREILELEPLRRGHPRVLAGHGQLDRSVRWVHVSELPDIAYLLHGGELLLTTGLAIAESASVQQRYVTELAAGGVAGLAVELGRSFDRLPAAMVRAAESARLPLVALERETRFVEVTKAVHKEIINRQYELLRRAEQVSRELTELILAGVGPGRIVGRLAEISDSHVVLEDEDRQVVEISGPSAGLGELLAGWDKHARGGHDELARGTVHRCGGEPRCMWMAVWLRHDLWGRLHVIETRNLLDDITALLVDRVGAAISLALLSEKDADHLADRARSSLVSEVASGQYGPADGFLRRARSLGADLRGGHLAVLAIEASWPELALPAPQRAAAHVEANQEARRLAARAAVATDLRQAATRRACGALVGLVGNRILGVVSVPGARPISTVLEEIVEEAARRGVEREQRVELAAGASGETPADALPKAADEAMAALAVGRQNGRTRRLHHFGELGTYQLLLRLAQGPRLAQFVESELRRLLDHDARARTRLFRRCVPTLSTLGGSRTRSGRSVSSAARFTPGSPSSRDSSDATSACRTPAPGSRSLSRALSCWMTCGPAIPAERGTRRHAHSRFTRSRHAPATAPAL